MNHRKTEERLALSLLTPQNNENKNAPIQAF